MINLSAFEVAHRKYKKKDMPFLTELLNKTKKNKIYRGLKILHNTPLTVEAVLKIETLVSGGADITVSCIKQLPPQEEALQILKAANIKLQIEHVFNDIYDIHLDCCGDLINTHRPTVGAVELTQTGSEIYKNANVDYPVVSVDDSSIKFLETFFGTGDGFIRALHKFSGDEMYDKAYVVFGFGKVGKGIVYALKKYTNKISTIVDMNSPVFDDYICSNVNLINSSEIEKIKGAIKTAYCIVTATGVENVISKYYDFNKNDFGSAILVNMGADDEYGENFKKDDVLFEKKPLNFSISEPTTMKYLDPVFYAHNLGIDILLSGKMQPGYNCFPADISDGILNRWQEIHRERFLIS